jgi:23S rRNA A1618 N6-methylase RlmF
MSNQLPIVVNRDQLPELQKLLDRVIAREADEIEIAQSQGPVATHAIFVTFFGSDADKKFKQVWVVGHDGKVGKWLS